jgi:sterol desaturase/sphingolipid hydroxylase (fatty acid hydroxylase superfamily)
VLDPSLLAIPGYFLAMGVEYAVLRRRDAEAQPAADYTRADTLASLSMGIGSIAVPLMRTHVLRRIVPGRTRLGTAVAGVAVMAAAATTVADRRRRRAAAPITPAAAPITPAAPAGDGGPDAIPDGHRPTDPPLARMVAQVGGVSAVLGGGLSLIALADHLSASERQWERRWTDLGSGVAAWTVAMVGWDLAYYLNHRLMHEVRALWAVHVVHHSSEHYNLSTALRQPVAGALGVWVPYGAMARLGVRPALIEYARGLNLIYQFWIHTDTIRSLGAAEVVLNSPSHHRVHHGANPRYLDRNHAGILIVWDRLLGTFQREDPEDPPVYGLTRNIHTYNPVRIVTHEYRDLIGDIARSTTWRDRLSFVLRGPGWAYRRRAEQTGAAVDRPEVTAGGWS